MNILVFLLNFIDYEIGYFSIADYSLMILLLLSLRKVKLRIKKTQLYAVIVLLICIFFSYLLNYNKDYFSSINFIQSLAKLILYIVSIFYIPSYIKKKNIELEKIIYIFILLISFAGLYQRITVLLLGRNSWPLYSLGSNYFSIPDEISMFNNIGEMRVRSFYKEPANFATHLTLLYGLLLYKDSIYCKKPILHICYIVSIFLSSSVSGYGMLLAVYLLRYLSKKYFNKLKNWFKLSFLSLFAILFVFNNDYIKGRLTNLLNLKDHSAVVRTVGGWQFLQYVPFYGIGMGNNVSFYKSIIYGSELWFSGSGEFYNNILIATITMGYVGMAAFIAFEYFIFKDDLRVFTLLIVSHFMWGRLFVAPIWIYAIFYIVIYQGKRNEKT